METDNEITVIQELQTATKREKVSKRIKKRRMYEEMKIALGVVTIAAQAAGIDRGLHYDWMKEDPRYKAKIDGIEDIVIDFVESRLHKLIEQKDTAATIFFMKTKGKRRGYIDRSELEINANTHLSDRPVIFE